MSQSTQHDRILSDGDVVVAGTREELKKWIRNYPYPRELPRFKVSAKAHKHVISTDAYVQNTPEEIRAYFNEGAKNPQDRVTFMKFWMGLTESERDIFRFSKDIK